MLSNKRYIRIRYNKSTDSFELQVSTDNQKTWSMMKAYKCYAIAKRPDGEPQYIHYSVITQINQALDFGFIFVP